MMHKLSQKPGFLIIAILTLGLGVGACGKLSSEDVAKKALEVTVMVDGCAAGSGMIYRREGNTYSVLTAHHVVKDAQITCLIITPDGFRHNANPQVTVPVPDVDLAVMTFTSEKDYKLAKWGDSDKVAAGQTVYVAGAPEPTEAIPNRTIIAPDGKIMGKISQPNQGYSLIYNNITQPGMSGGPVLDDRGKVIGVHGQGDRDDTGGKTGRNLGIPIATFLGATEPFIALDSPQSPSSDSNRGTSDNNPPPSPSSRRENEQKPSNQGTSDKSPSPSPLSKTPKTNGMDMSNFAQLEGKATVVMVVNGQPITIEVDGTKAPITAGNFVDLVQRGVYDGLAFHRVVREPQPFVVQGGDPQGKDPKFPVGQMGTGGFIDEQGNRRFIPLEIIPQGAESPIYSKTFQMARISQPPALPHTKGAVAMARSQPPDSASSQFYFALDDLSFLDGNYAVFGYVTDGMNVVDQIQQGDRIESAKVTAGAENLRN